MNETSSYVFVALIFSFLGILGGVVLAQTPTVLGLNADNMTSLEMDFLSPVVVDIPKSGHVRQQCCGCFREDFIWVVASKRESHRHTCTTCGLTHNVFLQEEEEGWTMTWRVNSSLTKIQRRMRNLPEDRVSIE